LLRHPPGPMSPERVTGKYQATMISGRGPLLLVASRDTSLTAGGRTGSRAHLRDRRTGRQRSTACQGHRASTRSGRLPEAYNLLATRLNSTPSWPPRNVKAPIAATATNAAINAYSIAVTPDSSLIILIRSVRNRILLGFKKHRAQTAMESLTNGKQEESAADRRQPSRRIFLANIASGPRDRGERRLLDAGRGSMLTGI
jgi:hypothetical protein